MVNGTAKFDIDVKEFDYFLQYNFRSLHYNILATIEEDFTGVKLSETGSFKLYANRYKIDEIYSDTRQELMFRVTYVDGTSLKDSKIPVKVSDLKN